MPGDRPEMKYINRYVTDEVCAKWLRLGVELLDDEKDVAALYAIQSDATESKTCCSKMFQLWLERRPEASWRRLVKALKQIHMNSLASNIEKLLLAEQTSEEVAKTDQVLQDSQLTQPSTAAEQKPHYGMFRKTCIIISLF